MAGHLVSSPPAFTAVPNLAQIVTTKLNRENYFLWKTRIVPTLRGALLMGYLDGTTPCPVKLISETVDGAAVQRPNPEYLRWVQIDQSLLGLEFEPSRVQTRSTSELGSTRLVRQTSSILELGSARLAKLASLLV